MKTIPTIYRLDNIDYVLRKREGDVAIYDCSTGNVRRSIEVVRIRAKKENSIKGQIIPAREALPSPSEWGRYGWTYAANAAGELLAEAKFALWVSRPLPTGIGATVTGLLAQGAPA